MTNPFSFAQWVSLIASVGVFLAILPMLAYRGVFDTIAFVDVVSFMSAIVSWPVAAVLIAFRFMARFQSALDQYLRGVGRIKLPGGVEFQSTQEASSTVASPRLPPGALVLSEAEQAQLASAVAALERDRDLTIEQKKQIEGQAEFWSGAAVEWKFRYLNEFFVDRTKQVLLWFSSAGPQTTASYHTLWTPIIADENQRNVILTLLQHFGLVVEHDGVLRIATHGFSFLQFVGLVPPTPTAG